MLLLLLARGVGIPKQGMVVMIRDGALLLPLPMQFGRSKPSPKPHMSQGFLYMKMGVYRTPAQKAMMAGKIIMGLFVAYLLATTSFAKREGGGSQGGFLEGGNGGASAKQGMIKAEHAGGTDAKPWDVKSMGRNMNVLITGGAGYIGSHMALLLLDQGRYNVTIVDNLSRSFEATVKRLKKAASKAGASDSLHWRKAELYDTEAVTDILKEGHIDLVLALDLPQTPTCIAPKVSLDSSLPTPKLDSKHFRFFGSIPLESRGPSHRTPNS